MGVNVRLCSGAEAVRKFKGAGWTIARRRGSHVMMTKADFEYTLSIPQHKELGPGILHKLTKQAEITVEAFNAL